MTNVKTNLDNVLNILHFTFFVNSFPNINIHIKYVCRREKGLKKLRLGKIMHKYYEEGHFTFFFKR